MLRSSLLLSLCIWAIACTKSPTSRPISPDTDNDSVVDEIDNCDDVQNLDQANTDDDAMGDACDPDDDNDGDNDIADNCPLIENSNQADLDSDQVGDGCDEDQDGDGVDDKTISDDAKTATACTAGATGCDNCPLIANENQADTDDDDTGDACDIDADGDGVDDKTVSGATATSCTAGATGCDNCPLIANGISETSVAGAGNQANTDKVLYSTLKCTVSTTTGCYDDLGDACDDDYDNDGIKNTPDNCPYLANSNQDNQDQTCASGEICITDLLGDVCDPDLDGDDFPDKTVSLDGKTAVPIVGCVQPSSPSTSCDNCPSTFNPDQTPSNAHPERGIACQIDTDGDEVYDDEDNCQMIANPLQTNTDQTLYPSKQCTDLILTACKDNLGDACDPDADGDGVDDKTVSGATATSCTAGETGCDNCPLIRNGADQKDTQGVGNQTNTDKVLYSTLKCTVSTTTGCYDDLGDACDPDADGDGTPDKTVNGSTSTPCVIESNNASACDRCPLIANQSSLDTDVDLIPDACDNCAKVSNFDQSRAAQIADTARTELAALNLGDACAIKKIASGAWHNCIVTYSGDVKCWGLNDYRQLGYGPSDNNSRGDNPSEMGSSLPYVSFGAGLVATDIGLGRYHTCAILKNASNEKQVKCWGHAGDGELGVQGTSVITAYNITSNTPKSIDKATTLPGTGDITGMACGERRCCVLRGNRPVCWGQGNNGGLGDGTTTSTINKPSAAITPVIFSDGGSQFSELSMSQYGACALQVNGNVWCWGWNNVGQLGINSATDQSTPQQVQNIANAVAVRGSQNVWETNYNYVHRCAIYGTANSRKLKCWGENYWNELGRDTDNDDNIGSGTGTASMASAVDVTFKADNTTTTTDVLDASLGRLSSCAIYNYTSDSVTCTKTRQALSCWGNNDDKEAGTTATGTDYGKLANKVQTKDAILVGSVVATLKSGQTDTECVTGEYPVMLASGFIHNCVITSKNHVRCWGYNGHGELGKGNDVAWVLDTSATGIADLGLR